MKNSNYTSFTICERDKTYLVVIPHYNGVKANTVIKRMTRYQIYMLKSSTKEIAIIDGNLIKSFDEKLDIRKLNKEV